MMRIVVPIKQVPETQSVRMDEVSGTMVREGVEAILNPLDLYALETALRLTEHAAEESEIIALSMGPRKAEDALREALSMGVTRAILLSDRAFAGADTWATACTLAAAVRKLRPFDLILCGERATDGDTGQVGPGLAACLDLPVLTYTTDIRLNGHRTCTARRLVERGREQVRARLPTVVTVVKEIGVPRLPTLRGKQRARRADIAVWDADTLGLDADSVGLRGSPTRVERIFRPKVTRACERIYARNAEELDRAAEHLSALLAETDKPLTGRIS